MKPSKQLGGSMGFLVRYLIIINIIGFIVYGINKALYENTDEKQIDVLVTVICLMGGSVGIFLFIVLFDRKSVKDNMMSRVFLISVMIIQIILVLLFLGVRLPGTGNDTGMHISDWKWLNNPVFIAIGTFCRAMIRFFTNKVTLIYWIVVNVISFITYAVDKFNAIEHRSRIRIVTLLGLALAGGTVGSLLAMYMFNHKTKRDYFVVGVPLIMLMHFFVIYFFFR